MVQLNLRDVGDERMASVEYEVWWCVGLREHGVGGTLGFEAAAVGVWERQPPGDSLVVSSGIGLRAGLGDLHVSGRSNWLRSGAEGAARVGADKD